METMEAIFERRSIRRFKQESVSREDLREIVRAGAFAATGGNRQKWRFVAVADPERVAATTETLGWLNAWQPLAEERPVAHAAVLAPADASTSVLADCAAAIQNMMLAAWDRGIGSCWFGSIKRERLADVLGVPAADWQIVAVLAFGYPAEEAVVIEGEETKVTRDADGRTVVPKKPLNSVMSWDAFA